MNNEGIIEIVALGSLKEEIYFGMGDNPLLLGGFNRCSFDTSIIVGFINMSGHWEEIYSD